MNSRYTPPSAGDLAQDQQRVAAAITGGLRGEIPGPLAMWLLRPELADRAQRLGEYARYQTCLPPRLSEVAILAVARHWNSEFEWHAHKQIALDAGVSAEVIESIRTHRVPGWDTQDQAVVHAFAKTLLQSQSVSDELFERAIVALGREGVVDRSGPQKSDSAVRWNPA